MGIFTETLIPIDIMDIKDSLNFSEDEREFYDSLSYEDKKTFISIKCKRGFNLTKEEHTLDARFAEKIRSKYGNKNTKPASNDDRPFFIRYPIFLVIILGVFIVMCLKTCSDSLSDGDPFGVETTIKSYGSHGE